MATRRLSWALIALFGAQLLIGVLNVALLAPIFMQIIHLFMADLVWIALVLAVAAALGRLPPRVRRSRWPSRRCGDHSALLYTKCSIMISEHFFGLTNYSF